MNRVFLGHRAYGFEATAETYYGKPLAELNLAQHAMLAVPSTLSQQSSEQPENPRGLDSRQDGQARHDRRARSTGCAKCTVTASFYGQVVEVDADYVAEMVRQEMVDRFGNAANDGYVVYTTVDSKMQQAAHDALLKGLRTYDWRHGWRGPERLHPAKVKPRNRHWHAGRTRCARCP